MINLIQGDIEIKVMQKEKQAQIIDSDDKKLQIINHRPYVDRFGCYCVEGAVKNVSQEQNLTAEIKIDYFDFDGVYVDTEVDTAVRALEPGVTVAFQVMYSGRRRGEITNYYIVLTPRKTISKSKQIR